MGAPGFDDAPLVSVPCGPPKKITFVYPFYCNSEFLSFQLGLWSTYPAELRHWLAATIVDDCSPEGPAEVVLNDCVRPFPIRLFRIEVDKRWNWLAARNIGMKHSEGWCLMTDMDHVVTETAARALVHGQHDPTVIYRLSRREHTGEAIHPHPNSMLLTHKKFWQAGGYDEELSGLYGTDGDWRRRCAATAKVLTLKDELVRHQFQKDSSTTRYLRKQPEDAAKKRIVATRKPGWRPRTLSFPFHEVTLT